MSYGMTVEVRASFADTVQRTRDALADQGFGVLTEIDVAATLKAKLGEDMEDYLILGACNPPLAHAALEADRSVGLLLPCNVVVRAMGADTTVVEILDPLVIAAQVDNPAVDAVAEQAARKLSAVRDRLAVQPERRRAPA